MSKEFQQTPLNMIDDMAPEVYSILFKQFFINDYQDFVTFVINELDIDYDARILDIGCGPGWMSLELARRMPEAYVVGLDQSEKLVRIAGQNKAQQKITNIEFVKGTPEKLSRFSDGDFDCVISYKVLHLLNDQQNFFNEIKRVLKKGGKYAVTDYRSDLKLLAKAVIWYNGRTMPKDFREFWKRTIATSYTLQELVNVLLKTKLKDWKIQSTMFDFLIYNEG